MSGTSHGYPTATISRRGPAPHRWTPLPASTSGIGCPGPGTGGSTTSCIVINMAAIAQIRLDTEGRTYYRRKFGEARTRSEARRCLKRRVSDMVYSQLVAEDRKSTRLNSSHAIISYAVFCLKKTNQIIITSARASKKLTTLDDRVFTRFEWGLITVFQAPDLQTGLVILRKKAYGELLHWHDQ